MCSQGFWRPSNRRQQLLIASGSVHDRLMTSRDPYDLQRFVDAQDEVFEVALAELRAGSKSSHWMWFIFPQIEGLGQSAISRHFAIQSINEAIAYLQHPLLGDRLRQSVEAVLPWAALRSADEIFGPVDAMKLRSSLTLFDKVAPNSLFASALNCLFDGKRDDRTLALLNAQG